MKVIFLTRKYPPSRGGMETFSFELYTHYAGEKTLLHAGKKQRDIFWVAPYLFLRAIIVPKKSNIVYHLGDLALAPVGALLHFFTRRPVVVTVHGLELTYRSSNIFYRFLIDRSLPYLQQAVCVSHATKNLLAQHNFPPERSHTIPHGLTRLPPPIGNARTILCRRILHETTDCSNRFIILLLGRLVRRKGALWFLRHVLPKISDRNPLILIGGDGPERAPLTNYIHRTQLHSLVHLLGEVNEEEKTVLYHGSDLFVMPNIPIDGDIEGFGFVALEATSAGLPVIASRCDGIPDAIFDEKNGRLVEPNDANAFAEHIHRFMDHPAERQAFGRSSARYTMENFQWQNVATRYQQLFQKVMEESAQ